MFYSKELHIVLKIFLELYDFKMYNRIIIVLNNLFSTMVWRSKRYSKSHRAKNEYNTLGTRRFRQLCFRKDR